MREKFSTRHSSEKSKSSGSEWYIRASFVEANSAMRRPIHERRERATHNRVYGTRTPTPIPLLFIKELTPTKATLVSWNTQREQVVMRKVF
jgi:hypothetical protein